MLLKLSELRNIMASLALALDKAAFAKATGATPTYPSPIFMLPKPKPKPRPQPLRQDLGNVGGKRKAEGDAMCTCSCKVTRLLDALTDLDKLILREAEKHK